MGTEVLDSAGGLESEGWLMCQQHEAEMNYLVSQELRQIRAAWEKHKSGEAPLTDEQIKELVIRKIMLDEQ